MKISTAIAFQRFPQKMGEAKIFRKFIEFQTISNRNVRIEAVYEDSLPSSSNLGTVIAFHGSPGSHKDFKYIRAKLDEMNIRFIGINYPGFKNTKEYEGQDFGNEERQIYSNKLLDELDIKGKIIYMGHSRGSENALMTAVHRNSIGLVMINPIGLRPHIGISPQSRLRNIEAVYNYLPKRFGDAMIYQLYKFAKFRVVDGEEAINALRSMNRCAIEKQLEFIEKLNDLETKLVFLYSGNDHLVEKEVLIEVLEKYKGVKHFNFNSEIPEDSKKAILDQIAISKGISIFFENDGHFLNKTQADIIASSVRTILSKNVEKHKI